MNTPAVSNGARLLTWPELGRQPGPALLIINSPDSAHDEVANAVEALSGVGGLELHVVASPAWRDFLAGRGLAARVLLTEASSGLVEINHFLETSEMLRWSQGKGFRMIAGSAPHNQYNLEVKQIFEERVLLLLGDGRFLAHSLPGPYVYLFDAPSLVTRFGRASKVAEFVERRNGLLQDLHALWVAEGRPPINDNPDFSAVAEILGRHLGTDLLDYDEANPLPRHGAACPGNAAVAAYVGHLRGVLLERDQLIESLLAELRRPLADQLKLRLRHRLGLGN